MNTRLIFATLTALLLTATTYAQSPPTGPARTAEGFLRKVLAANGANSPLPSPNAAEVAALKSMRARVTERDELEIENWPTTPLRDVKTVGQLNGLVGQLSNTGIYKAKAEQNAREALRKEQLAAMATRKDTLSQTGGLGKTVRITLTKEQSFTLHKLGMSLNDDNQVVSGGKAHDPRETNPLDLIDASEVVKKKLDGEYDHGAEAVEKRLADKKLTVDQRNRLERLKKDRDNMIADLDLVLKDIRAKVGALEKPEVVEKKPAKRK